MRLLIILTLVFPAIMTLQSGLIVLETTDNFSKMPGSSFVVSGLLVASVTSLFLLYMEFLNIWDVPEDTYGMQTDAGQQGSAPQYIVAQGNRLNSEEVVNYEAKPSVRYGMYSAIVFFCVGLLVLGLYNMVSSTRFEFRDLDVSIGEWKPSDICRLAQYCGPSPINA